MLRVYVDHYNRERPHRRANSGRPQSHERREERPKWLEHRWNTSLEGRGVRDSSSERAAYVGDGSCLQMGLFAVGGRLTRNEGVRGSNPRVGFPRLAGLSTHHTGVGGRQLFSVPHTTRTRRPLPADGASMVRSPLTGPDIEIEVLITVQDVPPVLRRRTAKASALRESDSTRRRRSGAASSPSTSGRCRRSSSSTSTTSSAASRGGRDPRPESLCPIVDTIEVVGSLPSWPDRWLHLKPLALNSMCELRELNAAGTPTAHGGARWWPSTVRAVLDRVSA